MCILSCPTSSIANCKTCTYSADNVHSLQNCVVCDRMYNERISTDLNLVTQQSTVHGPPEDGLKNGTETCRGKFLSVLNVNLVLFKAHGLEY
jgi:hypothetical protein